METILYNRIVDLLKPHMEEGDRRTLITPAFNGYPALYSKIKWTGSAHAFTVHLVEQLDKYGELEPGYPALVHLLQTVHPQVGWQNRREIDILQDELTPTKGQAPKAKGRNSVRLLRVFLCHAADDKDVVRDLYKRLKLDGVDPWLDEQKLLPGQDWQQEIPKAVRQADVVLVALSHNAISAGGYIREEISFALETANKLPAETIYIIPVKLEECDVPQQLARWQWVDISQANGYGRLIRALQIRAQSADAQIPVWQSGPYEPVTTSTPKSTTERPKQESPPWFWLFIVVGTVLATVNYLVGNMLYNENRGDITPPAAVSVSVPSENSTLEPPPISSPTAHPKPIIGFLYINSVDGATYLPIPAGEFLMGSTDEQIDYAMELCNTYYHLECQRDWLKNEKPQRRISLDNYWIMKTEVTNVQYRKFMEADGYSTEKYWTPEGWTWREGKTEPSCWDDSNFNGNQQPVVCISWYEADAYTKWLSAETRLDFRLPTEAQWEKAARGIDGRHFPWGNQWDGSLLNQCDKNCPNEWGDKNIDDGYTYTAPVGNYQLGASPYGVLDMAGNVWEWTADWYDEAYYANSSTQNPMGPKEGTRRVLRGGSWFGYPDFVRAAGRSQFNSTDWYEGLGLRVVLSSPDF